MHGIAQKHSIGKGKITVLIDTLNVIAHGSISRLGDRPCTFLQEDYDIRSIVYDMGSQLLNNHGIELEYKHIYNHMEKFTKANKTN